MTEDNLKSGSQSTGDTIKEEVPVHKQKIDSLGRAYATGKRKNAVARIWLKPGQGKIIIGGKDIAAYFRHSAYAQLAKRALALLAQENRYDISGTVNGGGVGGQAGAICHGISKALAFFDPSLRTSLKKAGFLKRDARVVERKKPGQPKARKKFQFSKR